MAGAVLAATAGCEDLSPGPREPPPAIELHDVTLRQYDAEGLAGIGTARVTSYQRDSGQLAGRSLVVDVPASPRVGRDGLHVEAGQGDGDLGGRVLLLGDGVRAATGAGDRATSDSATYRASTDVLDSDAPLAAHGTGYELHATRWLVHVHERRLEASRGSRLEVLP